MQERKGGKIIIHVFLPRAYKSVETSERRIFPFDFVTFKRLSVIKAFDVLPLVREREREREREKARESE